MVGHAGLLSCETLRSPFYSRHSGFTGGFCKSMWFSLCAAFVEAMPFYPLSYYVVLTSFPLGPQQVGHHLR